MTSSDTVTGIIFDSLTPVTPHSCSRNKLHPSMSTSLFFFFFFLLVLHFLPPITTTTTTQRPFVGFTINPNSPSIPPPSLLPSFLLANHISHVHLLSPSPTHLLHLSTTPHIHVTLSLPSSHLPSLLSSPSLFLSRHVLPFRLSLLLLPFSPLLPSTLQTLSSLNLSLPISASLPFSSILHPFPPSQASFNRTLANSVLLPLLRFLSNNSAPLAVELYPYYVFMTYRNVVPLGNALFNAAKDSVDPNTLLRYDNVFDAMVDAVYFAMRSLNFSDIPVLVRETGWPSKGDPKVEPFATKDNADAYNSNLIRKVLVERSGTPLRPEFTPSVFVYELFNEDEKKNPISEANWGLFYPNMTPVYLLQVSGIGGFLANVTTNKTFCVVADGVKDGKTLQAALDWACGPGQADCEGIQPGEECYEPNDVRNHASYAFDSYYQKEGKAAESCYFQGAAMVTTTDPSHGSCIFPRSKVEANSSLTATNGTQISDASNMGGSWFVATGLKRRKIGKEDTVHILVALWTYLVVTICLPWT